MNERDDEAPFPREPWQRLHEGSSDGPPETTDARIRAAARRDLAPRGHRWWLPASLAASLLLAVVLVRSELGSGGRIHFLPSADTGSEAMRGRIVDRNEGEQAREPGRSPEAASTARQEKPREEAESDVYGYADSEQGQEDAGAAPRVGGPERERRSASEAPEENMPLESSPAHPDMSNFAKEPEFAAAPPAELQRSASPAAKESKNLEQVIVTGSRASESQRPSSWTPTHVAAPVDNVQSRTSAFATAKPSPEAWYAEIEKLRAAGRTQEADRELEKLKKTYPGWLEQHLEAQKKP